MTNEELIARLRLYGSRFHHEFGHNDAADRIEALAKRLETAAAVVEESGRMRGQAEGRAEALVKELKAANERVAELEADRVEINRANIILVDQLIAYLSQNAPAHRDVIDALHTARAALKGEQQ
jgi:hypothetical protein